MRRNYLDLVEHALGVSSLDAEMLPRNIDPIKTRPLQSYLE